ncbi:PfkB family carbohydrate kinase [Bradyrhizobium liaoningense]|uniref:PfkB family carbohydrate kinase n=1 Tax=Bradyrhizobium liaoningense TaxID=43992 RepID=UPI001BAB94E0|nr:PfkB family carbohydrate kinase [Bradyrhizobium liaoningense]MBR0711235.1 adenylyltransferase/cytidyltransferase family protein [Bradyrhizobium liaoningense]
MANAPTGKAAVHPAPHEKIKTLEELGAIARAAQAEGRTVALCHGVFDLVHLGHARHILAARNEADVVIVTITADRFVNKGPGRPIFPENMRAEMLAALGTVDWVGINRTSSAEPVLDAVRPDIYVKGSDYENPEDDVTGKIATEREAVERHGGRIVFTRDVTFSSSSLLNRYFDIYDPPLRDYLQKVRESGGAERLLKLIDKIQDMHVVLVGDTIIDEYQYVTALGKASKENIVATLFKNREQFAGGVIAAANHVASFCKSVEIVTTLGGDDYPEEFLRAHIRQNVKLTPIRVENRPTTRKLRYVELGYLHKLFEVYTMNDTPVSAAQREEIDRVTTERVRGADVVIVTDFGHGMIASSTIDALIANSKFLAVNAQSNSGNHGYNLITKYPRADYICIDAPEARLAATDKFSDIASVIETGLHGRIACDNMIITHGSFGCYPFSSRTGVKRVPAFTKTVVDTVGAGDAFLTITAPLVAAGGSIEDVAFIGNAAGAIKVGIVGHRSSVEKAPLVKFVTALLK